MVVVTRAGKAPEQVRDVRAQNQMGRSVGTDLGGFPGLGW